jgi:hypothetical protein
MNDNTYEKYGRVVTAIAFLTAVAMGVMQGIGWYLDGNPLLPSISIMTNKRNPSISMEGNWHGTYNINNIASTLIVSSQSNNRFEGILTTAGNTGGTFRLAIEGSIDSETRRVTMTEVGIISKPLKSSWYLGRNEGTLSSDFRYMSGSGEDDRGNYYKWRFSKQ